MAFDQLSKKLVLKNPYYSVFQEQYSLPNGEEGTYFAVRGLQTVFIVPMTSPTQVVVTKQYRYLLQEDSWEFPAGRIDPGETPDQAAHRELEEEAGYRAKTIALVGTFGPCNGLSDEICYVFLATDLELTKQHLEMTEAMSVHRKTVDEFQHMVDNNTVRDGMTIAAWALTSKQRKDLFS